MAKKDNQNPYMWSDTHQRFLVLRKQTGYTLAYILDVISKYLTKEQIMKWITKDLEEMNK